MSLGIPTVITSGVDDTDATSYVTASTTFTAERLYILGVLNGKTSPPVTAVTVSGTTSGTWTSITGTTFNTIATNTKRISTRWFYASSTFSEVITMDFAATTQIGCVWVMLEITGADNGSPITQISGGRSDTVQTISSALTTFGAGGMGIGFAALGTQRTLTASNGYTLLGTAKQGAAPVSTLQAFYKTTQGDPGVTWITNSDAAIASMEVAAAQTGVAGPTVVGWRKRRPAAYIAGGR